MSMGKENELIDWIKKYKKLLISLATIVLIILMVILVDFRKLLNKISMIGLWGSLFFIIFYTIAFLLRAYKLKIIFKGLNQYVKFSSSFFSIGVSFIINDITPGQIGDIVRIFILKDQEDISMSESFIGIAIERGVDFLILFSISLFALIYLFLSRIGELDNRIILGQNLQFYLYLGVVLIIIVLILLLVLLYKQDIILKIIKKISNKLYDYLDRFLTNFKNGLYKFKDHKKEFFYIIILNIPMYIINASILVIFFIFLGYNLNVFIIILAALVLFFSGSIPITPGGWGISENIGALFIFIVYPEIAYFDILTVFIINHLIRTAYLFFYGGYSLLHLNFKLIKARKL